MIKFTLTYETKIHAASKTMSELDTAILGVIGLSCTIGATCGIFILKKLSNMCERIASLETKADIYHGNN